ncbi:MAG: LysM peptidoglycan-binding domain-containing protein [Chloroflexi bacterium]|nr:LysM peptidoglycan-binding domain-containing protein [Chloroflexota bacterium]
MPQTYETKQDERKAYLLDISLFVFDLLNLEKIINKVVTKEAVVEVPSALVTMIWSSISGDSLLIDLIYAHIKGMQRTGLISRNSSAKIHSLSNATDERIRQYSVEVYERIINRYSFIIDGVIKKGENDRSLKPIQRYEPILIGQSDEDLLRLRSAYNSELGLKPHPLYDLYFLQIHHAQSVGIAASPILQRIFVFLGEQAAGAFSRWIGTTDSRAIDLSARERYSRHLAWFVNEFIADEFFSSAVEGTLGIGVSFIFAGVPGINFISGVSVANLIVKTAIKSTVGSPWLLKETDVLFILMSIFSMLFFCVCIVVFFPSIRKYLPGAVQQTPTPLILPSLPPSFATPTLITYSPSPEPVITSTFTAVPIVSSPFEVSTPLTPTFYAFSSEANYCMYVVQAGDTLSSVAARFQVSESNLRAGDILIGWGAFSTNQLIRVNSSCCRPANVNGFSYTVKAGETLYSIARNNLISAPYLASVNNLFDSSYIQTGQMLCVPLQ